MSGKDQSTPGNSNAEAYFIRPCGLRVTSQIKQDLCTRNTDLPAQEWREIQKSEKFIAKLTQESLTGKNSQTDNK